MSIVTRPAGLIIAGCTLGQERYDILESSDATGHQALRLFGPPRWRMGWTSHPALPLARAAQWEALQLQLRGGANLLLAGDPVRTQPQGTLRGLPTLASTAAAGATTLQLAGCIWARQHLLSGSFETDSNADGMADNWALYDSGSAGTVTAEPGTVIAGVRAQRVRATALNTSAASQAGVSQLALGIVAGQVYRLSVAVLCSTACTVALLIDWQTAGGASIGTSSASGASNTVTYTDYSLVATAPAGAVRARVFLTMHSNAVLGSAAINLENVQLELGSVYTGFAPGATLLAGDWLQLGAGLGTSQLVKAVVDSQAGESGQMSVQIEPPLRQAYSAGTAVGWAAASTYWRQVGAPQWAHGPGGTSGGFALDLLEAFA